MDPAMNNQNMQTADNQQQPTMNRAMRRFLQRNKKPLPSKVVPLPPLLDEWTIFDIPERILTKLQNGEIEAVNGRPVFYDMAGDLCEVCPALSGWIYTWQRINDELGLNLNLGPIGKVHNKLHSCMPLQHQDVFQAQAALDSIRQVFRMTDRQEIKRIAQEAQIAILVKADL